MSGSVGGTLELWSSMKKKPVQRLLNAHSFHNALQSSGTEQIGKKSCTKRQENEPNNTGAEALDISPSEKGNAAGPQLGAGCVCGDAVGWIGSVGSCRGSDLVVSVFFTISAVMCLIHNKLKLHSAAALSCVVPSLYFVRFSVAGCNV